MWVKKRKRGSLTTTEMGYRRQEEEAVSEKYVTERVNERFQQRFINKCL
jgi:hypothetical protein